MQAASTNYSAGFVLVREIISFIEINVELYGINNRCNIF